MGYNQFVCHGNYKLCCWAFSFKGTLFLFLGYCYLYEIYFCKNLYVIMKVLKGVVNNIGGALISNTMFNNVVNESGGVKKGEVWLSGFVGDEWSDMGVSMKNLKNYVEVNGLTKCTIYLNTGGGYVSSAMEIASYMQMSKDVTFKVVNTGIVASAGVIILVTADKAEAVDGSLTMIHDPTYDGWGSLKAKDLKNKAVVLEKIKDSIIGVYVNKMKKMGVVKNENEDLVKTELGVMMEDETWFTADETKKLGFVNEVIESGKVKKDMVSNCLNLNICNSLNYRNMSKVQEMLDKLMGKSSSGGGAKNEKVDDAVKAAMETLKNAGYEVEEDLKKDVEKDKGKDVSDVEKALNLLKAQGYKVEEKSGNGGEEGKEIVEVKNDVSKGMEERMSKLETLMVKIAENSLNSENAQKESTKRIVKNSTMPIISVGGNGKNEEEEEDKKEVSIFSKIKNGSSVEKSMNQIAEAFK